MQARPCRQPRPCPATKAAPPAKTSAARRPQPAARHGAERLRTQRVPEDRQSQLKLLIARGKEQGYLTYAQVNDHLPSEIVDPEQIEDIVNTINDMGIPVYEKAPDTESLLAAEPSSPADEEAIEEAAAALAALDAELGRTTDPVRMYMREMGTVELLTREGEIRIAKRIEEGLDAVRLRAGQLPGHARAPAAHLRAGQGRPGAPGRHGRRLHRPERAGRDRAAAEPDQDRRGRGRGDRRRRGRADDGDDAEEEAVDTGPDPEEVARRLALARARLHQQVLAALAKLGRRRPDDAEGCARSSPTSSWS